MGLLLVALYTTSGCWTLVESSMYCEELCCLYISGLFILLWPAYYISGVADGCRHWCRTCLTLLGYLAMADFFATSSRLTFVCGIPRYLYQPSISAMFSLVSLVPTVLTTFPILVTIWPHLSRLNNILCPSLWQSWSVSKCFTVLLLRVRDRRESIQCSHPEKCALLS